jgi:hypothetical protein
MYMFLGIITVLFLVCYCIVNRRKRALEQLLRVAGYQAYYYMLGSRGLLEDRVFGGCNKTRMYVIKLIIPWCVGC